MRIYLNAGHGGTDSGAVGIKIEKIETLKLAKSVKPILESAGHTVVMSRDSDTYMSVTDIANDANAKAANLFIAIHLNAYNGSAHGTECLVVSSASTTSKLVATEINKRLAAIGFTNRGVKVQDTRTYVLSHTNMPATTVEVCFIDNADDMQLYAIKYNDIVKAIAEGILAIAGGTAQNKLEYIATKDTVFITGAKEIEAGTSVELKAYPLVTDTMKSETLARAKLGDQEGLIVFSDFKKGE